MERIVFGKALPKANPVRAQGESKPLRWTTRRVKSHRKWYTVRVAKATPGCAYEACITDELEGKLDEALNGG